MSAVKYPDISLADQWPLPAEERVRQVLEQARKAFHRPVLVLDDDPTGTQTVHDLPVYTDWSEDTLCQVLESGDRMSFILTNSRSFSVRETERVHLEIGRNLASAARKTGRSFLLVSRGDSTLRGHYPLETETLRRTLEQEMDIHYDGEIIMPYFKEGGRLTIGNVHYVKQGEHLVPAGETEFARDNTFGYRSSDLTQWCEEKTAGTYLAEEVIIISLEELRGLRYSAISEKLMTARAFAKVVVNAADDRDVEVFVAALLDAIGRGKEFLFRCAAGLVRVLGGVAKRPVLTRAELCGEADSLGGLVVVGSHVKKTTEQLECLLSSGWPVEGICLSAEAALKEAERERDRVRRRVEQVMSAGKTAVVYTSRQVLRAGNGESDLDLSVRVARVLTGVVTDLTIRPAFLVAKGGITSSEIGVRALAVRRAWVMGQAAAGVPVWKTGEESKFPGLPYVIFPGNVGERETLRDVVGRLLDER